MTGFFNRSGGAPSRLGLFLPFILFGVAIAIYAGYWIWMSGEIRKAAHDWIAQQEAEGYVIVHDGLSVSGFPFRFTVTARNPDMTAPEGDGGWRVQMPALSASALPYNISHWIVAFRTPAEIDLPAEDGRMRYLAEAGEARISLAGQQNATIRIGAEIENGRLANAASGEVIIEVLDSLILSGLIEDEDLLRLRVDIAGLVLGEGRMDAASLAAFGNRADRVRLDAAITRWSALAGDANLAYWSEQGGRMEIAGAQMEWGAARLSGDGSLGVDAQLRPEGRISITVAEPVSFVESLVRGEILTPADGNRVEAALMLMPRREGGVSLPLRLQQGGIFIGPARIGDVAPLAGPLPAPLELPEVPED